jgi:hypothetical protein
MADKQPAHVEQALREIAGTENDEQIRAARKRLAAAGYEEAAKQRREADEAAAADPPVPKSTRSMPQGRRSPTKQQG